MKFSTVAAAAALAVGSVGAFATTTSIDVSSGSAGFFNTPPAGGFSDTFNFTLSTAATFTGIVTSVVNGGQDVDLSSVTLSGPSGLFSFAQINSDPFEIWTLPTTTLLTPGSYSLTVLGVNSAAIGTYSGDIALSAAVPEPSSYALMLAGAGVIGFVAVRRRTRA
jgi:hypothetical protein